MDAAQTNTTYNGWSNYPTWAVNLWLSNDQGLYSATLEIVENESQESRLDDRVIDGTWTIEQATRFNIADRLKDWVRDELATTDIGAPIEADLLGWAFDHVNWEEIAASWIDSVAVL